MKKTLQRANHVNESLSKNNTSTGEKYLHSDNGVPITNLQLQSSFHARNPRSGDICSVDEGNRISASENDQETIVDLAAV